MKPSSMVLTIIAAIILGSLAATLVHRTVRAKRTMICAQVYGEMVCNEYDGHLRPDLDGCTRIPIGSRNGSICGTYTIEWFTL